MKSLFGALFLGFGCLLFAGCESGGNENIVEEASQSEVDEYNRLLQESNAGMEAAAAAAEEGGITDY